MQNIPPNRPDHSFSHYDKLNKHFVLCELFKIICDGEHLHFVNKMDQQLIARIYETK